MQRYESYKSSGLDWLGEVPSHWGLKKSKFLWREKEDRSLLGDEELLSVSQYSGVVPRAEDSRSESLEDYKRCEPNDLVINIMLAWMSGLGVSKYSGIVSPAYCVYSQLENHNPSYFDYLYRTPQYLAEFARRSKGIVPSRWRMYTEDFGQVLSLLPPREEQNRIVAFLDQKTAEIDAAIAKKERLIELLDEQKSIVINHAVTRGLAPGVPMADSGIGWLGEIPSHWMVKRVKHLARRIVDGAHHTPTYVDNGVPFLRVTDISGGKKSVDLDSVKRIPEREHKALCQRAFPEKGDILLSKNGTIGETIVVDWDFEFSIFVSLCLIKLRGEIDPHFFCLYFSSPVVDLQLAEGGKRTSVTNLHLEKIKELVLALPPIEEQREIVRKINHQLSPYDDLIEKTAQELVSLNDFKKSLTASVVVGLVKV